MKYLIINKTFKKIKNKIEIDESVKKKILTITAL